MASIKLKSSSATNVPSTLSARELAIHNNQLYFGSSAGKPLLLALDSNVVHKTGEETISGSKTFTTVQYFGATTNTSAYVRPVVRRTCSDTVHLADMLVNNDGSAKYTHRLTSDQTQEDSYLSFNATKLVFYASGTQGDTNTKQWLALTNTGLSLVGGLSLTDDITLASGKNIKFTGGLSTNNASPAYVVSLVNNSGANGLAYTSISNLKATLGIDSLNYLPLTGGTLTGNVTLESGTLLIKGNASDRHLITRGIGGCSIDGTYAADLYVNYGTSYGLRVGSIGQFYVDSAGGVAATSGTINNNLSIGGNLSLAGNLTSAIGGRDITINGTSFLTYADKRALNFANGLGVEYSYDSGDNTLTIDVPNVATPASSYRFDISSWTACTSTEDLSYGAYKYYIPYAMLQYTTVNYTVQVYQVSDSKFIEAPCVIVKDATNKNLTIYTNDNSWVGAVIVTSGGGGDDDAICSLNLIEGNGISLSSEVDETEQIVHVTIATDDDYLKTKYLPLTGGTMQGGIYWNATSLPQFSGAPAYLLGIDNFADGGRTKWQRVSAISVGSASKLTNTNAIGNIIRPVYFTADGVPKECSLDIVNYTLSSSNATVTLTPSSGDAQSITVNNVASANYALTVQAELGTADAFRHVWFRNSNSSKTDLVYHDNLKYNPASTNTKGTAVGELQVGNITSDGDVTIAGNLTVAGTTTTLDTDTLTVKDNLIVVNSGKTDLAGVLSGLAINKNSSETYGIVYDSTDADDAVKLGLGIIDTNGVFSFGTAGGAPIATRADSSSWTNNHVAVWDSANYKFIDSGHTLSEYLLQSNYSNTWRPVYVGTKGTVSTTVQMSKTGETPIGYIADKGIQIAYSARANQDNKYDAIEFKVNTDYVTTGQNYKVQVDDTTGGLYVNVPWTDTNTNTDTKNTAGATNNTSKLYFIGATGQSTNPQTYSNSKIYATDGAFHAKTVTMEDSSATTTTATFELSSAGCVELIFT